MFYLSSNQEEERMRKRVPQKLVNNYQLELLPNPDAPKQELPQEIKEELVELLKQWLLDLYKQKQDGGKNDG